MSQGMRMSRREWLLRSAALSGAAVAAGGAGRVDDPEEGIAHRFLATGSETYICEESRLFSWRYPHPSRDGWALADGRVLLALGKSAAFPAGGAVEVDRAGKVLFEFKGTQSEVNTVQSLENGNILLTEAGDRPRILEVSRAGRVVVDVPIQAQTRDHHLQTRMTRKLANGNYLVPQLLDRVVREYNPRGAVVAEIATPHMPFTAIRLDNGHTLVGCTLGNLVVEFDPTGKTAWSLSNDDLPGKPINDACGVQRLPNGNTVVTSHHARGNEIKLMEVTPAKKLVWTYRDPRTPGVHHVQVLATNGKAVEGRALR